MKKVGIIGGGQLGKMMILDGKRLDTQFFILDPTIHCPAHSIADEHIVAEFDDVDAIVKLASMVDVLTYEFEHISVEALRKVEQMGTKVYPSSETLFHIQNKLVQNQWLIKHNLPTPDFKEVKSEKDILSAGEEFGYPMMLKTCTGGYDGKGNALIHTKEEIQECYETLGSGRLPLMVERFVPFEKEVSILVCQSTCGDIKVFPIAENKHKNSILDETTVPAKIEECTRIEAMDIAKKTIQAFDAIGMLCIELFVTKDHHILINELAPRPHNSGHYTIEGCVTSQYENHIRGILGLPLGDTDLIAPTVMKNIIGETDGKAELKGLEQAYRAGNVKVHLYGKEEVRKGRKMGHITVVDKTVEEALQKAREAHDALHF